MSTLRIGELHRVVVEVVHVAQVPRSAVLDLPVLLLLPRAARVAVDAVPCVRAARLGAAEPAEGLPARAAHHKVAAAVLLHWHRALGARLDMRLHPRRCLQPWRADMVLCCAGAIARGHLQNGRLLLHDAITWTA